MRSYTVLHAWRALIGLCPRIRNSKTRQSRIPLASGILQPQIPMGETPRGRLLSSIARVLGQKLIALLLGVVFLTSSTVLWAEENTVQPLAPAPFIEKNVKDYEALLARLKAFYRKCCAGATVRSTTAFSTLTDSLPSPKTLRYTINHAAIPPPFVFEPRTAKEILFTSVPKVLFFPLSPEYGNFSSMPNSPISLAADDISATLLQLPREVAISVSVDARVTEKLVPHKTCCVTSEPNNLGTATCMEFADYSPMHAFSVDPRHYVEHGVEISTSTGLDLNDHGASVTAVQSGRHELRFRLPKFSEDEIAASTTCQDVVFNTILGDVHSQGTVPTAYNAAGFIEHRIDIISYRFHSFGFDPNGSEDQQDRLRDYFHALNNNRRGQLRIAPQFTTPASFKAPRVWVDNGDSIGFWPTEDLKRKAVSMVVLEPGPVVPDGKGGLRLLEGPGLGPGASQIRWSLNDGAFQVDRRFTYNDVWVELDPRANDGRVRSGTVYDVRIFVQGPVDLVGYNVQWSGDVRWQETTDEFQPDNTGIWVAHGQFTVDDDGSWQDSRVQEFGLISLMSTQEIQVDVSNPIGLTVFDYKSHVLVGAPAVKAVAIYAGEDSSNLAPVEGPLDLFFPNQGAMQRHLGLFANIGDGNWIAMSDLNAGQSIQFEMRSSDAQLLPLAVDNTAKKIVLQPGRRTGQGEISARIGGGDLDPNNLLELSGEEAESGMVTLPVRISVNQLLLTEAVDRYTLTVIGGADLQPYTAHWQGVQSVETSFTKIKGKTWVTKLELSDNDLFTTLELRRGSEVMAVLPLSSVPFASRVQIIPPQAPFTVLTKTLSDAGQLEPQTECRQRVEAAMIAQGKLPGNVPKEQCKAERKAQKKTLKTLREEQKAQNKLLDKLEEQGQKLIVFDDQMEVGAAIEGMPDASHGLVLCDWSITGAPALILEQDTTLAQRISKNSGACFNIISGLEQGFVPGARIEVSLVLLTTPDGPPAPKASAFLVGQTGRKK